MAEPDNNASDLPANRDCFVVMPYGRNAEETRWFKGWYELAIHPAIEDAGYNPLLAATNDAPSAINDEIRTYLYAASMVVVDLGGRTSSESPNPNVMYELGIRHALNLPVVMMAWEGQSLPFDIGNQRVLMERRELVDISTNRERLVRFIKEAEAGNYYRPMDAVARASSLIRAESNLSEDSLLGALIEEVRDMKHRFEPQLRLIGSSTLQTRLKGLLEDSQFRSECREAFQLCGGSPSQWAMLMRTYVPDGFLDIFSQLDRPEILDLFCFAADKLPSDGSVGYHVYVNVLDNFTRGERLSRERPLQNSNHSSLASLLDPEVLARLRGESDSETE